MKTAKEYILEKQRRRAAKNNDASSVRGSAGRTRVLVISDTHGRVKQVEQLLEQVKPIDLLIHCGDVCGDEKYITSCAARIADCPALIVRGNNDFTGGLRAEEEIILCGQKILVMHGHRNSMCYDPDRLACYAEEKGAGIVCFGHTHVPEVITSYKPILLLNPGSLSLPRASRDRTYAMLELDDTGFKHAWINILK